MCYIFSQIADFSVIIFELNLTSTCAKNHGFMWSLNRYLIYMLIWVLKFSRNLWHVSGRLFIEYVVVVTLWCLRHRQWLPLKFKTNHQQLHRKNLPDLLTTGRVGSLWPSVTSTCWPPRTPVTSASGSVRVRSQSELTVTFWSAGVVCSTPCCVAL